MKGIQFHTEFKNKHNRNQDVKTAVWENQLMKVLKRYNVAQQNTQDITLIKSVRGINCGI